MAGRLRKVLGIHAALVLICHAGALGCAPPGGMHSGSTGPGSGKADDGSSAGELQCVTSFDCPLTMACGAGGSCTPLNEIEPGASSPTGAASLEEVEGQACSTRNESSGTSREAYAAALQDTAYALYGEEPGVLGSEGERLQNLSEALADPEEGTRIAEALQRRMRRLRNARDAAEEARQTYRELFNEASRAEDQLLSTARSRPSAAVDAALEYLADRYEAGVRVVIREPGGEWQSHPMYERTGRAFEPALDAQGLAEDGLFYISTFEIERVLADSRGFHDYRGVSRIFQIRSTLGTQLGWLERMSQVLDDKAERFLEAEGPNTSERIGDLLADNGDTVEELRWTFKDLVDRSLQRFAEVNRQLHATGSIWDFAEEHPEVRIRTLTRSPQYTYIDCDIREWEGFDPLVGVVLYGAGLYYGWLAGVALGAAILSSVALWPFWAMFAAIVSVGVGLNSGYQLAGLVYDGYEALTEAGDVPAEAPAEVTDREARSPIDLWGPLFRAVARGDWTPAQAGLVLKRAKDDPELHDCMAQMHPQTFSRLGPTDLDGFCEQR